MPAVSMTVNGKAVTGNVEERTLLVQFLREHLRLTGTHVGCDTSQCGACVVHIDGIAGKSCTLLALQCEGMHITTIEGLAEPGGALHPMQEAFREHHGLQCGYCTPGMIMAALDIVRRLHELIESRFILWRFRSRSTGISALDIRYTVIEREDAVGTDAQVRIFGDLLLERAFVSRRSQFRKADIVHEAQNVFG